jgi:hypothetical protein
VARATWNQRARILSERTSSVLLQARLLPPRRVQKDTTLILFFNTMFGARPHSAADLPEGFELSHDPRRFDQARAVVFHVPSLGSIKRLRKLPGQLWVGWWMEPEQRFQSLTDPDLLSRFDLTMSHRLDADVHCPYFRDFDETRLRQTPRPKKELAALFVSGSWEASGRTAYLAELLRHLDVHSYGRLLRNRQLSEDRGPATKLETIGRYRFTLAFESSIERDYVTEKLYEPLAAGSVPVYLGAPNVERFVPSPECYLDVRDHDGPRALAERLLELAGDEDAYQACLRWKTEPFAADFRTMLEEQRRDVVTRLCELIDRLGR